MSTALRVRRRVRASVGLKVVKTCASSSGSTRSKSAGETSRLCRECADSSSDEYVSHCEGFCAQTLSSSSTCGEGGVVVVIVVRNVSAVVEAALRDRRRPVECDDAVIRTESFIVRLDAVLIRN